MSAPVFHTNISLLESLGENSAYKSIEDRIGVYIADCLRNLETVEPDKLLKVQGQIEAARFILRLREKMIEEGLKKK